jgi:hypothetical protein
LRDLLSSVRSAKAWTKDAVLRVLKNPLYTGRTCVGGEFFKAEHDAIVDGETFARVAGVLGDGGSRSTKSVQRGYLLRGLLRCGACGAGLTPASAFKGKREYRYYRCQTRDKQGTRACPCAPLPAKAVEEFVISELRKATLDRGLATRIMGELSSRLASERKTLCVEGDKLPAEISKLSAEASRLVDAFAKAPLATQPLLQRRLDEIGLHLAERKKRMDHVEQRLRRLEETRGDLEWVEGVLSDFDPLWKRINHENRARVVRALIHEVRVDEQHGSLRITFRTGETAPRAA